MKAFYYCLPAVPSDPSYPVGSLGFYYRRAGTAVEALDGMRLDYPAAMARTINELRVYHTPSMAWLLVTDAPVSEGGVR